ncbi:MAG: tetraacyldisaccharide 4'-kinase [Ignavibacteriales bacterium]|nr:tetraacyldisaccharide 4'-kinase [Ignavibacteriales bacterium]
MKRARLFLLPFSLFYWLGVTVRNWFFDIGILKTKKVSVPVISVGNISAGGVGKTPFVELLIEKLAINGQLSVVSRGYGRKSIGTVVVSDGRGKLASVENSGDEPIQLALKYPELIVVVDEQRVRGAQKAVALGAKMILLDDGFQHRYVHRDLNIVILTAEEILKGDVLLPSGNRREPLTSLKRADVIAVTRCADTKEYEHVCTVGRDCSLFPTNTPTIGLTTTLKALKRISSNDIVQAQEFKNKNVIAFSGIGNPKSFEDLLLKADINIVKHLSFSDHHWYKDNDLKVIIDARKQTQAEFIITTEKDATRLRERFTQFLEMESVIVAEIQMGILSGEQTLDELFNRLN